MINFDLLQKDWAEAQKLPKNRRHHKEERLVSSIIKEFPSLRGLGSQVQLLCENGNPSGWAFTHGLSVHWFPTRGIAKKEYYRIINQNKRDVHKRNIIERLGRRPKPCTLLEACEWGGWGLQAWI